MNQKYIIFGIVALFVIAGVIFVLSNNNQKTHEDENIPIQGVGAFKALNNFYLNQGESKSLSLDGYEINVEYMSSSPQTIKFTVDGEIKTVVIKENEGCASSYGKIDCKLAGIYVKDSVVFGIDAEKEDWDTDRLHIFCAVTMSSSDGKESLQ